MSILIWIDVNFAASMLLFCAMGESVGVGIVSGTFLLLFCYNLYNDYYYICIMLSNEHMYYVML